MAAQGQRAALDDPDLATVVDAWDRLPEAVRAGILAMVKAASKGGPGTTSGPRPETVGWVAEPRTRHGGLELIQTTIRRGWLEGSAPDLADRRRRLIESAARLAHDPASPIPPARISPDSSATGAASAGPGPVSREIRIPRGEPLRPDPPDHAARGRPGRSRPGSYC
jgi:hypothetical protein